MILHSHTKKCFIIPTSEISLFTMFLQGNQKGSLFVCSTHTTHTTHSTHSLCILFIFISLYIPSCIPYSFILYPGVMARFNRIHGRAEGSDMDLSVYCPPDVLHMGGPLFGDTEGIKAILDEFLGVKVSNDKFKVPKCRICGYPECECSVCLRILNANSNKTKATLPHTCALKHSSIQGAPPKLGYYDVELTSKLLLAWQEQGIPECPKWVKGTAGQSGYYWPEEM